VFANLRYNKQLTRFNFRGKAKVNTQWNLYCMVHNIEFSGAGAKSVGVRLQRTDASGLLKGSVDSYS
jgi:hypothetical protein